MAVDIRINRVDTDLNVIDPEALLTPPVLERIVEAVRARLEDERLLADQRQRDRASHRTDS